MSTSAIRYPTASLKPDREKSLLSGHLWIFSGALQQPPHWIEAGGLVDLKSSTGQFIARGYYNPHTDIAIRILTHNIEEAIDSAFFRRRIRGAMELRQVFDPAQTNTYGLIDSWQGQKTGFFIDQRDKREALRKYARNERVLNCFSYTGGFSVYAALTSPQTSVTSVDISAPAIETARQHFTLNGLDPNSHQFLIADVFDYLEQAYRDEEQFDVVVLDPPAFAKTQSARPQALKAYRRLNMLAMQVLRPGGILLSCSCSGVVGMDDLLGVLSQVAQRLHLSVQLLETYTHGVDHPINLAMPETSYLKAVFCRVGLGA